jgi:hypothetical protein
MEWKEDGQTRSQEGSTNSKGMAGPYSLPRSKVFIQVTTDGNRWEHLGREFDLKTQSQPIEITLTAKQPTPQP